MLDFIHMGVWGFSGMKVFHTSFGTFFSLENSEHSVEIRTSVRVI